jgi:hypothetical protein
MPTVVRSSLWSSLDLDAQDRPCIAFHDGTTNEDLKYAVVTFRAAGPDRLERMIAGSSPSTGGLFVWPEAFRGGTLSIVSLGLDARRRSR